MNDVLTFWDVIVGIIYVIIIAFWGQSVQKKHIKQQPLYKWYTKGLMVKCFGAISVCLIYTFYYQGGDTINYFNTARCISNVLGKDPKAFLELLLGRHDLEIYSVFDATTGYPTENWRDPMAVYVSRLFVPLCLLSFKTYIGASLLVAWICYSGIWHLFLLFNHVFPGLEKQFSISMLFIPSVVFWGSGLLKDTITLAAVGWFTYYFYAFFIQKNYKVQSLIFLLLSSYLLLSIKPYILLALLPGAIIWLSNERLVAVKNNFLRVFLAPFFLAIGVGLSFLAVTKMGDAFGDYSVDKVLVKAVESSQDQKQAYYGGNSFDIGDFDATAGSIGGKAHLAIAATLFRPTLLDARNPVMLLSALENTYIMFLTIFLLIRLKFFGFFSLIGKEPLLLFSLLFSLFFAFSVGIATSNFGTLVRLKIPCIPFFVSSLFVLKHLYEKKFKIN